MQLPTANVDQLARGRILLRDGILWLGLRGKDGREKKSNEVSHLFTPRKVGRRLANGITQAEMKSSQVAAIKNLPGDEFPFGDQK